MLWLLLLLLLLLLLCGLRDWRLICQIVRADTVFKGLRVEMVGHRLAPVLEASAARVMVVVSVHKQ